MERFSRENPSFEAIREHAAHAPSHTSYQLEKKGTAVVIHARRVNEMGFDVDATAETKEAAARYIKKAMGRSYPEPIFNSVFKTTKVSTLDLSRPEHVLTAAEILDEHTSRIEALKELGGKHEDSFGPGLTEAAFMDVYTELLHQQSFNGDVALERLFLDGADKTLLNSAQLARDSEEIRGFFTSPKQLKEFITQNGAVIMSPRIIESPHLKHMKPWIAFGVLVITLENSGKYNAKQILRRFQFVAGLLLNRKCAEQAQDCFNYLVLMPDSAEVRRQNQAAAVDLAYAFLERFGAKFGIPRLELTDAKRGDNRPTDRNIAKIDKAFTDSFRSSLDRSQRAVSSAEADLTEIPSQAPEKSDDAQMIKVESNAIELTRGSGEKVFRTLAIRRPNNLGRSQQRVERLANWTAEDRPLPEKVSAKISNTSKGSVPLLDFGKNDGMRRGARLPTSKLDDGSSLRRSTVSKNPEGRPPRQKSLNLPRGFLDPGKKNADDADIPPQRLVFARAQRPEARPPFPRPVTLLPAHPLHDPNKKNGLELAIDDLIVTLANVERPRDPASEI